MRLPLFTRDAGTSGPAAASWREVAGWWRKLESSTTVIDPDLRGEVGWDDRPRPGVLAYGIGCHGMFTIEALVASVCGLSVQIFVGGRFYRNAYTQFKSCSWGMDSLWWSVTVVTYSSSLIDCCVYDANHQHLLFDTAAMLLLFVTLGKFLESRAKQRTGAVEALLALRPVTATLLPSAELRDVATKLSRLDVSEDASLLEAGVPIGWRLLVLRAASRRRLRSW